jgi:hypothetical protein
VAVEYDEILGVERNPKEAYRWYMATINAAVHQFDYFAMSNIARHIREGRGFARDPDLAAQWDEHANMRQAEEEQEARDEASERRKLANEIYRRKALGLSGPIRDPVPNDDDQ